MAAGDHHVGGVGVARVEDPQHKTDRGHDPAHCVGGSLATSSALTTAKGPNPTSSATFSIGFSLVRPARR
jgi:hypothetical protein